MACITLNIESWKLHESDISNKRYVNLSMIFKNESLEMKKRIYKSYVTSFKIIYKYIKEFLIRTF